MAVIAPHWTQLDGVTSSSTRPSLALGADLVDLRRAHFAQAIATSRGTRRWMRMWSGWSSRLRLPLAKTDESLSNVSLPSRSA